MECVGLVARLVFKTSLRPLCGRGGSIPPHSAPRTRGLHIAQRLTVTTYNTYRERTGRDETLDALLRHDGLTCLQEASIERARELRREFGQRVFLSRVMFGWELLAIVLPKDASFVACRSVQLNAHLGLIPKDWTLWRAWMLRRGRSRAWKDGLIVRAVQVCHIVWRGREFILLNTHLPFEWGLRDRCLGMLPGMVGDGNALLCGDLNATTSDVHLADMMLETVLHPAGDESPTLGRRRIDYVAYRGGFRELEYDLFSGRSDHRGVRVELEVA